MHYGSIKTHDIANGPGVRVSLFVSGCRNACKGCFQEETWDFNYGSEYTQETENQILSALYPSYIQGITLLGGEPFETENQTSLLQLVKRIRQELPSKNIWCYTGCTLENELSIGGRCYCDVTEELLSMIDVLVDGRFILELADITLKFRGSSNQRLIDMKETKKKGTVVLWKE